MEQDWVKLVVAMHFMLHLPAGRAARCKLMRGHLSDAAGILGLKASAGLLLVVVGALQDFGHHHHCDHSHRRSSDFAKTRLPMSASCRHKTRPDLSSGQPALRDSKEARCTVMLGVGVVVNGCTITEGGMGSGPPRVGHAKPFPQSHD